VRFHAKEETEGRTFRWTGRQSFISILGAPPDARQVTLWLSDGGRPPLSGVAYVEIFLGEERLGAATVTTGFRPYSFSIPAVLAAASFGNEEPARLRLVTEPWKPSRALGTNDTRDLGVMVDRVEVR
jgi:hypothetical protein